jgi:hypothetical protein
MKEEEVRSQKPEARSQKVGVDRLLPLDSVSCLLSPAFLLA